jgi:hypothetical protein
MKFWKFRDTATQTPEQRTTALRDSIQAKLANYNPEPEPQVEDIMVIEGEPSSLEMHVLQFVAIATTIAWSDKESFPKFASDACMGNFKFGDEAVVFTSEQVEEFDFLRLLCIKQFNATDNRKNTGWSDSKNFDKQVF